MNNKGAIFRYKVNKGLLHNVPALAKLLLLLPLSIICMSLPIQWFAVGIGFAVIIAFLCKFTIREQLTDLKPALYYVILMYLLSLINNIYVNWPELSSLLIAHCSLLIDILLPDTDYLAIVLRLILIIQLSALLFRTTSGIEIREALCGINKQAGTCISLFLSFIPQIFENWSTINKAWKARGGKDGLRKIRTIIFVLISLSLEKASIKAKALEARSLTRRHSGTEEFI